MKRSRFTDEQIVRIVKSVEGGLKTLEDENSRLKRVVADLSTGRLVSPLIRTLISPRHPGDERLVLVLAFGSVSSLK